MAAIDASPSPRYLETTSCEGNDLDSMDSTCCLQVGYCIMHNGRMCSALEDRYLGIRRRCLRAADALGALSYEAQAPLKMRPHSLGQERACESVNAYLQVCHNAECAISSHCISPLW